MAILCPGYKTVGKQSIYSHPQYTVRVDLGLLMTESKKTQFCILLSIVCNFLEPRRYSLRQGTRKSYKDLEVAEDDVYICKYLVMLLLVSKFQQNNWFIIYNSLKTLW